VGQGFLLTVIGTVTGILASLVVTRGLSEMLFETPRTDIETYAVMSVLLLLVTACASYFPARRAAQTDPMLTLRQS
jgi:putative ABC transport system permease protein